MKASLFRVAIIAAVLNIQSIVCYSETLAPKQATVMVGGLTTNNLNLPHTIIRYGNEPVIEVDREPNGKIILTIRIYSLDGLWVSTIRGFNFLENKMDYFQLERRGDEFIVYDQLGRGLLSVLYKDNSTARVMGTFFLPGSCPLILTPGAIIYGGNSIYSSTSNFNQGADLGIEKPAVEEHLLKPESDNDDTNKLLPLFQANNSWAFIPVNATETKQMYDIFNHKIINI